MTRRTKTGRTLTDEELIAIADEVEHTEFTLDDLEAIKKTQRRSPRWATPRSKF